MEFEEYLVSMLGKEKAEKILNMDNNDKANIFIVIEGKQGPTGKTTLKRILEQKGYKALESRETIVVALDRELQCKIPNFNV